MLIEFFIMAGQAPQDIKILGWYPVGSVLLHGEKVPL